MKPSIMAKLVASTLVLASGIASAVGVAANTGHDVWNYANEACVRKNYLNVGIQNSCSAIGSSELWAVELPANAGGKTVTVSGTTSSLGQTQCIARAINQFGVDVSESKWVAFPKGPVAGGTATISLTGASVPTNGTLQVQCQIFSGLAIFNINYSL